MFGNKNSWIVDLRNRMRVNDKNDVVNGKKRISGQRAALSTLKAKTHRFTQELGEQIFVICGSRVVLLFCSM